MSDIAIFVLVGHCGPDAALLKSAVGRAVPGAAIVAAHNEASLQSHLQPGRVLLINRALDGSFNTRDGVELMERVLTGDAPPVALLISNYADAQERAMAVGGKPGFGKSAVYAESTRQILRDAAGVTAMNSKSPS